uniref:Shootin-1 n=1 Tax=Callorhinchus milii TaxID=7868 RepID=A0A4W3JMR8_CALMI
MDPLEEAKHIKNIAVLSKEATIEYEELIKENEQVKNENARLLQDKHEALQKVKEFHRVSQLVVEEVSAMQNHLEIEKSCRENAEVLATKLNKDNKNLKRISAMYMAQLGKEVVPLDLTSDEDSDVNTSSDKESRCVSEECQKQISELRDKLVSILEEKKELSFQLENLKSHWEDMNEKLQEEKERNTALTTKAVEQNEVLSKYNKVSALAVEEYEDMEQSLELEKDLRNKAESFAHEMLVEQKKLKRQSQFLMEKIVPSEQLLEALREVVVLTGTIENERIRHKQEMEDKEEQLKNLPMKKEMIALLKRLDLLEEDKKELELKCKISEQRGNDLKHTIDELQKQIHLAANPQPPPPPPPPPLPPPSTTTSNPLKNLMALVYKRQQASRSYNVSGTEKDSSNTLGGSLEDLKQQAVDEMMERIKKGVNLRKVKHTDRPPVFMRKSQESAVQELKGMLKSSKAGTLTTVKEVTEENELERILRVRKASTENNVNHGKSFGSSRGTMGMMSQSMPTLNTGNEFIRKGFNRTHLKRELSKNANPKTPLPNSGPSQEEGDDCSSLNNL